MRSVNLSPFSAERNRLTLIRLQRVMDKHKLTRAMVADLLGVSRVLVTRWFASQKRCADNRPEMLRTIIEIRARQSIDEELHIKRKNHTKRRKETPSYPRKD
jgi:hypothetical protein